VGNVGPLRIPILEFKKIILYIDIITIRDSNPVKSSDFNKSGAKK